MSGSYPEREIAPRVGRSHRRAYSYFFLTGLAPSGLMLHTYALRPRRFLVNLGLSSAGVARQGEQVLGFSGPGRRGGAPSVRLVPMLKLLMSA